MATNSPSRRPPTPYEQSTADFSEEILPNMAKQLSELATSVKSIQISLKTSTNTSEHRKRSTTHCYIDRGKDLSLTSQIRE
jgi:hypothetical protein